MHPDVVETNCAITARNLPHDLEQEDREVSFTCHDIGRDRLDTTAFPNGEYTLFAQPACRTSVQCPIAHKLRVEFRN